MSNDRNPKVTASIVTFETSRDELARVVDSALNDCIEKLYIIDHTPDEGCRGIIPENPKIVYLSHENKGYGSGHNVAIRLAIADGARYHAVLNPDIYWEGKVVKTLTDYMDIHADVGQMLPKVLYPDGRLQYTCKLVPTPYDLIIKRFLPAGMTRKRMERFQLEKTGYQKIMNVPYMHGCFMLLRISALEDVGMFDERFFMYPEDIDLTRRIHARWKTLFYPDVHIYHAHAAASRHSARMLWIHIVNMIKYFNKWGWISDKERREFNKRLISSL